MQSIIVKLSVPQRLESATGHTIQIRNHVKNYPWRRNRLSRESCQDPTETPYTDRINMNEFDINKRKMKPWQRVTPKEKDNRFNAYKWNDSYKSDPKEAQQTAERRWEAFAQSVIDRGSARETRQYNAPDCDTVRQRVLSLYKSSSLKDQDHIVDETDDNILRLDLNHCRALKLSLISRCIEEFSHHLPTPYLNDICTIQDLVKYYSTSVRGLDPYTSLARKDNELPPNLFLVTEPHRWDKETDKAFDGYNAYPGIIGVVPGLRGKKKYPTLNQEEFQWPDI